MQTMKQRTQSVEKSTNGNHRAKRLVSPTGVTLDPPHGLFFMFLAKQCSERHSPLPSFLRSKMEAATVLLYRCWAGVGGQPTFL